MKFPTSSNTKRIWLDNKEIDSYVDFCGSFEISGNEKVCLQIACDSAYVVWLNGKLTAFSGCGDYPWYKLYDCVDITADCKVHNDILIQVWYIGAPSQTYYVGEPGLVFEIAQGDQLVLASNRDILCRKNIHYRNGYQKVITGQMGFGFCYDATDKKLPEFTSSTEYPVWGNLVARTASPLCLNDRAKCTVIEFADSYLIDMGEETVGFLDLEFICPTEQKITICFGEHLVDGQVPRIIGTRDFSVEYIAKPGENRYINPFRRLAGRYLQVYCEKPLHYGCIGLRQVDQPVTEKKVTLVHPLDQKIYDVSVNTLKKCMHEHYEDCPWREQAMYTMDSRNQMLCGYEAFEGFAYQKQNLLLIAQGQREDGLLSLCFPAGSDIPIPFFSMVYLMQLAEYVQYSGDREILNTVAPVAHRIMDAFTGRIEENGLIANLPYPYWNFYEWEKESNHEEETIRKATDPYEKKYDLILNAMYVYAGEIYNRLYSEDLDISKVKDAIQNIFYVPETGMYKLSTKGEYFSRLGNSMALLIGLGDEALADNLINDESLIPVTLSMSAFFYDALLRFGDRYRQWILEDIRRKYQMMLDEGSTTFWETEKGWQDFDNAGSLCHGWSAIPVYYLKKLL